MGLLFNYNSIISQYNLFMVIKFDIQEGLYIIFWFFDGTTTYTMVKMASIILDNYHKKYNYNINKDLSLCLSVCLSVCVCVCLP